MALVPELGGHCRHVTRFPVCGHVKWYSAVIPHLCSRSQGFAEFSSRSCVGLYRILVVPMPTRCSVFDKSRLVVSARRTPPSSGGEPLVAHSIDHSIAYRPLKKYLWQRPWTSETCFRAVTQIPPPVYGAHERTWALDMVSLSPSRYLSAALNAHYLRWFLAVLALR